MPQQAALELSSEAPFFQNVYLWMCGGLIVTALTAQMIFNSQLKYTIIQHPNILFVFCLLQLGLVLLINYITKSASAMTLRGLFLLYSVMTGPLISAVLIVYPQNIVFKAFFSTAVVYGAMAVYGLVTKRSLQKWGAFLMMALVGLIASLFINILTQSRMFDYVICWFGVLIFSALTAYDHQKLRVIHAGGFNDQDEEGKVVIHGALALYLDFINLFIFIVRILGASRD
jgi:FtsH-binding integral membrane protein